MKVIIPIGSRAEMGLSAPIIRKMGEDPFFKISISKLYPGDFIESYKTMDKWLTVVKPNWSLIVGDRIEMTGAAAACFHKGIPFAHYFAGIINYPICTLDDINRHVITLWSTVQFVESFDCGKNVQELFNSIEAGGLADIKIVGITHLEDLSFDIKLVPEDDYNLVLYNPITQYSKEKNERIMNEELKKIYKLCGKEKETIFIRPNEDPGNKLITNNYAAAKIGPYTIFNKTIPRPQFLALLQNCSRFISNSSCTVYEAPYFLKKHQIFKIGVRNQNRPYKFKGYEASGKIVEAFKELKGGD